MPSANSADAFDMKSSSVAATNEYDRMVADRIRSARLRARKERRNEAKVLEREVEVSNLL